MALDLPTGPLKNPIGLELIPRCEPYNPIADDLAIAPSGPVCKYIHFGVNYSSYE